MEQGAAVPTRTDDAEASTDGWVSALARLDPDQRAALLAVANAMLPRPH